ncbi:20533_t:CDS:2 [Entrophospora sp. SA101]|nr:20533_t:CDS:2 [Entrophospora sp. SA101]
MFIGLSATFLIPETKGLSLEDIAGNSKLPPKHDSERAIREREVLQYKNKIVEVTEALGKGKLPTTSQISEEIDEIHQSELLYDATHGISVLGKKVLADLENLLDSLKRFFEEKNELQNVVVYYATKLPSSREGIDQEIIVTEITNRSLVEEGIKNILNISQLIVTNSEFRKLINDIGTIAQDIIAKHEPSSSEIPTPETKDKKEIVAEIKDGEKDKEKGPEDKKGIVAETKKDKENKEKGIGEAVSKTSQKAQEKVSTAAKSTTELTEHHIKEDSKEITSDIISSYQLSPEACERLVTRFKNVIIEIQKKPKYQQAIKDLINVIPQITEKSSEFATHITQHIVVVGSSSTNDQQKRGSTPSMSSSAVEQNTKDVESFADNRSLYPLISTLNDFGQKIKHDEDLREFLKDLEHFILSSLLEPEFVKKTDYIQQGSGVINKGRKLLLGHYCELTQTIVGEVQEFNKAMMEDKATMELKRDVDILIEDLFLNEIGQFTFKFQLVKDFSIILPRLAKRLEYIPLPEYEYSDENIEFNADNIVLHVQHELFPKHINIGLNAEIGLNRPEENRDSLDLRIAILTLPTDGSKPISIKLERNDIQDLIIKQAHQLVERFEEQMIIVQTQVMQNYRCHSTTKDIGNDQSKDKLKQKMTWKSSAFDPTLGTTTSSSAGGSGSGAAGGGDVDYNVTASSTNITPIIPVTPITTVTPAAATYNSASIIKATTDGKTPSNK